MASAVESASRAAGWAVGEIRRGRALHKRGVCVGATLIVAWPATRPLGVTLLDRPGQTEVIARLSKGISVPGRLPDVLGLAVRLPDPRGEVDLLMSTCAPAPWLWLPIPRRGFTAGPYSTVVCYRHPKGLLRLVARPYGVPVPADPRLLGAALEHGPLDFQIRAVPPGHGGWPVATLRVRTVLPEVDVAFDPILNGHPALRLPGPLRWIRRGTYAGSRRARHAARPG